MDRRNFPQVNMRELRDLQLKCAAKDFECYVVQQEDHWRAFLAGAELAQFGEPIRPTYEPSW